MNSAIIIRARLILGRFSSRYAIIIKDTVLIMPNSKVRGCSTSTASHSGVDETNKKNTAVNNVDERLRIKFGDQILTDESEELQPHWAALERRVKQKVSKRPGEGLHGRSSRRTSAWDAEYV